MGQTRKPLRTWILASSLSCAGYTGLIELVSAFQGGGSISLKIASVVGAISLGLGLGFGVALFLAPLRIGLRLRGGTLRWAEALFVALGAVGLAWLISDPLGRRLVVAYLIVICLFAGLCSITHWLARAQPRSLAVACAAAIAAGVMTADLSLQGLTYPELHDLCYASGVFASLAIATRFDLPDIKLKWLLTTPLVGVLCWLGANGLAADWLRSTIMDGTGVATATRAIRRVIDFDQDGFSPILGGGDCDDFDSQRHPMAVELPQGGDRNCNGSELPQQITAKHRGVSAPIGTPSLPLSSIDLFVLITVDCWRADTLSEELTPNLWKQSKQSMAIARMYSAASETYHSLPLTQASTNQAPWIGDQLRLNDITTSAVIGGQIAVDRWGMGHKSWADDAEGITTLALNKIEEAGSNPLFLWVHYYDLHQTSRFMSTAPPSARPDLPAPYRASLAHVDKAVGRLLATLKDYSPGRTAILITADHGEGLGDHGVATHARSGFESVIRVPGLLAAPSILPGERAILGSHRDLPATILGAFGLEQASRNAELFGRSWFRIRDSDEALHDFVYVRSSRLSSGRRQDEPLAVMIDNRFKLVAGVVDGFFQLYDLVEDPKETTNLADEQPDRVRAMWQRLGVALDIDGYPAH